MPEFYKELVVAVILLGARISTVILVSVVILVVYTVLTAPDTDVGTIMDWLHRS